MRRRMALVFLVSALGSLTPSAFGQYPYRPSAPVVGPYTPYGPPMMGSPMVAPPGYGPMPPYGPPPVLPYHPARPNVIIYGPLTDTDAPPTRPVPSKATKVLPPATPTTVTQAANKNAKSTGVTQVQATVPSPTKTTAATASKQGVVQAQAPAKTIAEAVGIRRTQHIVPDSCGAAGCDDCLACPDVGPCGYGPCDPVYGKPPAALRGHGRFLGEVGSYFLVPLYDSNLAYTTTDALNTGATNFPQVVHFAPRVSVGYLFHTGWGLRANYWYLQGSGSASVTNADINRQIVSALPPPFQIVSPSQTLQQGIGADQMSFSREIELHVADVELLKEWQLMETTFLFSAGARYARIHQSYSASRNNPGGFNGQTTVNIDREDLDSSTRFEGWGPTGSVEFIHMIGKTNLAFYSNLRGSFLFGVSRYSQDYNAQRNSVDNTGVPTFANTTNGALATDRRVVSIGEAEAGLQYGIRFHRAYVFGRAGAVYQRWWDVGSPTSQDGSLSFLGGTARIGITY